MSVALTRESEAERYAAAMAEAERARSEEQNAIRRRNEVERACETHAGELRKAVGPNRPTVVYVVRDGSHVVLVKYRCETQAPTVELIEVRRESRL